MVNLNVAVKAGETVSYLKRVASKLKPKLIEDLNNLSDGLTSYVKRQFLTSHSDRSVGRETGELYRSTVPIYVSSRQSVNLKGGVAIGTSTKARKYVNVHVAKTPENTTIVSGSKLLTIPLPHAKDSSGRKKLTARKVPNSTVKKIKSGKYRGGYVLGSQKRRGGRFLPYFLLVDRVTIPSRVHTEEITRRYQTIVTKKLGISISRVLKG